MINFIDRSLERYLRKEVPLRESTIGLSFEPPDKDWGSGLSRPTVNVFLWDVCRSERAEATGLDERLVEQGVERRRASPRVEFRYVVTAWATEVADEHRVLGDVLRTVLAKRELPADSLPEGLVEGTCRLFVETDDHRPPGDFWSALGGRFKPSLRLMVSAVVPVDEWKLAAPAPTSIEVGIDPSLGQPVPVAARAARWVPGPEATGTRRLHRNGVVTSEVRSSSGTADRAGSTGDTGSAADSGGSRDPGS